MSETPFVEETLDLAVINICTTNTISVDGDGVKNLTYKLGEAPLYVQPIFSALLPESRCPLTYSYEVLNKDTSEWVSWSLNVAPFTSFNTENGYLMVFTSNKALSGVYSLRLRI